MYSDWPTQRLIDAITIKKDEFTEIAIATIWGELDKRRVGLESIRTYAENIVKREESTAHICTNCGNSSEGKSFFFVCGNAYCRKCRRSVINRRVLAFLLDIYVLPQFFIFLTVLVLAFLGVYTEDAQWESLYQLLWFFAALPYILFKDGLMSGQSLGKNFLEYR